MATLQEGDRQVISKCATSFGFGLQLGGDGGGGGGSEAHDRVGWGEADEIRSGEPAALARPSHPSEEVSLATKPEFGLHGPTVARRPPAGPSPD